ncbi:MAG: hypothetical protein ORN98_07340, partial [Alphaproteobacteria bacterium]|nr:hypothetical protein [Alphaproteobacteria bacterium]
MTKKRSKRISTNLIAFIILVPILAACRGAAERQTYSKAMDAGNWRNAAQLSTELSGLPYHEIAAGSANIADLKPKELNWTYDAGLAWLNSGNYTATDQVFSAAENLKREIDKQSLEAEIGSTGLAIEAGEKTESYKYSGY